MQVVKLSSRHTFQFSSPCIWKCQSVYCKHTISYWIYWTCIITLVHFLVLCFLFLHWSSISTIILMVSYCSCMYVLMLLSYALLSPLIVLTKPTTIHEVVIPFPYLKLATLDLVYWTCINTGLLYYNLTSCLLALLTQCG